ncbi:acyl carrier protein [Nocardia cyriacigeorgica]|uniref:acyl carrier protein n=1 Tax=Nocardia cyriacigeorgica TaxID=135487 RepID=UPI00189310BC|nr:acyl carrier protein [Nocardia cyriacigeorgica]MBF6436578.1 acyl carrier protein [Nocardia cyriacigeorgica]MBF6452147.1 acyl carrier protein [Nocardia cyriacigeorgica]MBF6478076.1 acyl carrier protein [Nocardia cyriacigeorgica]MBF6549316.1 acyl carrier protein [Nocardia cyriacigeorgica]
MSEHASRAQRSAEDAALEDPQVVLSAIEDELGVGRPRPDLRMTDSIREDINLDSLSLMEAMTRVEERYGIELIDNPEIGSVETVADLVGLIQRIYRQSRDEDGDNRGAA